jgi:hypothetical protein
MDRVQASSFLGTDRPLLGQMAIATVLVGSAAALSSAGIAVPVSHVGFNTDWDQKALDTPRFSPAPVLAEVPGNQRISLPKPAFAPLPVSAPVLRFDAAALGTGPAPMTRIEQAPPPALVVPSALQIVSEPGLVELPLAPVDAPVVALALPAGPLAAPGAAPAGLAVPAAVPGPAIAPPGEGTMPVSAAPPFRLVNPPELRGFDLAKLSGPNRSVPAGFARPAAKSAVSGKVEGLGKKDTVVGDAVFHQVTVKVAGSDGTAIDVRIGADMKPSIKVGDLLGLVSDRMDPESAARFAAAASAADYVSLATLRAAGFEVSYNAGVDSISIGVAQ